MVTPALPFDRIALMMYTGLLLATMLWAGVFVVGKIVLETASPEFVASTRYLIAAAIILMAAPFIPRIRPRMRDWANIVVLAAVGVFAYNVLFTHALALSTAQHGLVIIATTPAITTLITACHLRRNVPITQVTGLILAFLAVALVFINTGTSPKSGESVLWGDILFCIAALMWSVYSIYMKSASAKADFVSLTTGSLVVGAVMLLFPAVLRGGYVTEIASLSAYDALAYAYMGVLGTVAAFLLWSAGISRLGAPRTSVFLNFVPIWGTILSSLVTWSPPSALSLLSVALVTFGVWLVQRAPSIPKTHPASR